MLTIQDIINGLGLNVYTVGKGHEREVNNGYTSDLLSDVIGHADAGMVWITLQTHKNVSAVATLKDLAAILLINGCKPEEDMLAHAEEEGIPVLGSAEAAFEVSGKLYQLLIAQNE